MLCCKLLLGAGFSQPWAIVLVDPVHLGAVLSMSCMPVLVPPLSKSGHRGCMCMFCGAELCNQQDFKGSHNCSSRKRGAAAAMKKP